MMWPFHKKPEQRPATQHTYRFDPQPDITVQELAWLWGNMLYGGLRAEFIPTEGMPIEDENWERIPKAVQRHLKRADVAEANGKP